MDEIIQIAKDIVSYLKEHDKCHIRCKYDYTIVFIEKEVKKLTEQKIVFLRLNDFTDKNGSDLVFLLKVVG